MRNRDATSQREAKSSSMAIGILRNAGLAAAVIVAQIAQSFHAWGGMSCVHVDEWKARTDPLITALAAKHFGKTDVFVSKLDQRFYIVRLDDPVNCLKAGCLYRLIQVSDETVQEKFAFQGTGWIVWYYSPVEIYAEPLNDWYSSIAVQTSENTFIGIHRPKSGNVVVIDARSAASMPRCDYPRK